MATIINNPEPRERTVVESNSSGWVVAVVILIIVIAGGVYLWMRYRSNIAPAQQGATINVTLPTGGNDSNTAQ